MTESGSTEFIYPIGVVAKKLKISVETIRLYEREGLLIINKIPSGHRRFSERDIERLECIRDMITEKGLNIEGIRRIMSMIPCWNIYPKCSIEENPDCPAYTQTTAPCWALTNKPPICENQDCYRCPVYQMHIECDALKTLYHKNEHHIKSLPLQSLEN